MGGGGGQNVHMPSVQKKCWISPGLELQGIIVLLAQPSLFCFKIYVQSVGAHKSQKRVLDHLGFLGNCELLSMGAGNWALVLCKRRL